jgi:hypothetical protein
VRWRLTRILLLLGAGLVAIALGCGEVLETNPADADAGVAGQDGGGGNNPPIPDAGAGLIDADDAAPRGRPCLWNAPFTNPPSRLAQINKPGLFEADPRLLPDELTIYFTRLNISGVGRVVVATRATINDPFQETGEITELNSPNTTLSSSHPAPSIDERKIIFTRGSAATSYDLFMSERQSKAFAWGTPVPVPFVGSSAFDYNPYLLPDGVTLYFASNRGTGLYRVYSAILGDDAGAKAVDVAGVDAGTNSILEPVVSEDQLTMWFAKGGPSLENIWVTHRNAIAEPFQEAIEVTELNTIDRDMPAFISKDLCRLYYATKVAGTTSDYDLFVASR